jgi:hypothetical protein
MHPTADGFFPSFLGRVDQKEAGPFNRPATRELVLSKPLRNLQTITEPELSISATVSPLSTVTSLC